MKIRYGELKDSYKWKIRAILNGYPAGAEFFDKLICSLQTFRCFPDYKESADDTIESRLTIKNRRKEPALHIFKVGKAIQKLKKSGEYQNDTVMIEVDECETLYKKCCDNAREALYIWTLFAAKERKINRDVRSLIAKRIWNIRHEWM